MTRIESVLGCLLVVAGCGSGSEAPPPVVSTTSSSVPAAPVTTTTPGAPTTVISPPPPPLTPEEARRALEERGIDPEEVSRQVGEIMRQRFKKTWTTSSTVR